jgi:hypothetical protein
MTRKRRLRADSALRRDVVLANRSVERVGLSQVSGHVSPRFPGSATFLPHWRREPGLTDERTLLLVLGCDSNVCDCRAAVREQYLMEHRGDRAFAIELRDRPAVVPPTQERCGLTMRS